MKNAARICAILLSFLLLATIVSADSNESHAVYGTYVTSAEEIVYSVDITWDSMELVYEDIPGVWNPETKTYDGASSGWVYEDENGNSVNSITVTNNSNTGVEADFSFQAEADFTLTGAFFMESDVSSESADTIILDSAADSADTTENVYLMIIEGVLTSDTAEMTQIGSITITINGADGAITENDSDVGEHTASVEIINDSTYTCTYENGSYILSYKSAKQFDSNITIKIDESVYVLCGDSIDEVYLVPWAEAENANHALITFKTDYTYDFVITENITGFDVTVTEN